MTKKLYEISINILAVIAVVLAVIDISKGLTGFQYYINVVIYIIFVMDYLVRLILIKDKKDFFKKNIFDLLAIIPFSSIFRVFRLLKLFRLTKLL